MDDSIMVNEKNVKSDNLKKDEKDLKIQKLEKELKFAKNQMANALSLYDEAKQEAEMAVKAKGEFISKLSHEFRTPMNALMGYSDILVKMSRDKSTERYTAGIKSATNRLLNMINDLIEVSRMESGTTVSNNEEYGTAALLSSVLDGMSDEVKEKGLLLKVTVDSKIPTRLYGDFYHLRQIVCNLMDNAIKYTDKGYISLQVDADVGDEVNENGRKFVQISFIVKDTGRGIRKRDQDKLFQAFSQFNSKNPYANEGVGIGLTVAKHFSNRMHGDITFDSKYGEGSCFVCTVLQEVVDDTPLNVEGNFVESIRSSIVFTAPEANILVVDDSLVNLNVAKGLLAEYEVQVDTANGGLESVKKVGKKKYDIIFMDHMMPDIDGIEAMKLIREKGEWCEKVPIIALTANVTDEARRLFKMEGMEDFLAKPIELSLLRDILVKWLPKDKIIFADISKAYEHKEYSFNQDSVFNVERLAMIDIDLEKGLSYFGGNLEAYKSTIRDIVKDCSKKIIITETHLINEDIKNYGIEAHSVKSISASIGADKFSAKAKEMEFKAKDGDKKFILDNGSQFIREYEKFLLGLGELLEEEDEFIMAKEAANHGDIPVEKDDVQERKDNQVEMPMEQVKAIINEALKALGEFETDTACAKLKVLCDIKGNVDRVKKIYEALEYIDDFEYDEAEKILKEIIS